MAGGERTCGGESVGGGRAAAATGADDTAVAEERHPVTTPRSLPAGASRAGGAGGLGAGWRWTGRTAVGDCTMVARKVFESYCGSTQRVLTYFSNSVVLSQVALTIEHTQLIAKCTMTTTLSNHMASFRVSSHVTKADQIMRSLT